MTAQDRLCVVRRGEGGTDHSDLRRGGEGDGHTARHRLSDHHTGSRIVLESLFLDLPRILRHAPADLGRVESLEAVHEFRHHRLVPTEEHDLVVGVVIKLLRNELDDGLNFLELDPLPTLLNAVLQGGERVRRVPVFGEMIEQQAHRRLFLLNLFQQIVQRLDAEARLWKPLLRIHRPRRDPDIAEQQRRELW